MEIEKIALEVFNNKETYKNIDFMVIMNILMEEYHKIKGQPPIKNNKEYQCELDNCCNVLYEDGLCWDCFNQRELEEGSDNYNSDSDDAEDDALECY